MFMPIHKGISLIQSTNGGRYPNCNCLFIDGGDIKAVIDTGFEPDDLEMLRGIGLDVIINSHFHEDHVLNNRHFPDVQVWAHELDSPAIRSLETFQEFFGFKIFRQEYWGKKFVKVADLVPCAVHRELKDGEALDFGSVKLQIVHTPGHTPGHCSFYHEKAGILFTADIDLSGFGPWYAHTCSDLDALIGSIRKCMEIDPAIILSGHKGIISENIKERLQKYLDVILNKENKVISCLQEAPMTLEQLSYKYIFYDEATVNAHPFMRLLEKMAIYVHMQRLKRLGEVQQKEDIFYIA